PAMDEFTRGHRQGRPWSGWPARAARGRGRILRTSGVRSRDIEAARASPWPMPTGWLRRLEAGGREEKLRRESTISWCKIRVVPASRNFGLHTAYPARAALPIAARLPYHTLSLSPLARPHSKPALALRRRSVLSVSLSSARHVSPSALVTDG